MNNMKLTILCLLLVCALAILLMPAVSNGEESNLDFELTAQILFQYMKLDQGDSADPIHESEFLWRRIRPSAIGTVGDFYMNLQFNVVPGSLELMDLNFNYKFHPMAHFRLGQFKLPFTRYRLGSYKNLQFVDWAIVSRFFGAERNAGIMVHNTFEITPRFQYEFGLFAGKNSRNSHGIGIARVSGETVNNPSDLVDGGPQGEFHPAVAGRFAYNHGGIVAGVDADFARGGPRFSVCGSGVWDANPKPYRDFALRLAPEGLFKMYGWSISGSYYFAFVEQGTENNSIEHAMGGMLVQSGYLVGRWLEVAARFSRVHVDEDFSKQSGDHAETGLAEGDLDELTKLHMQYVATGALKIEQELTAGINIYLEGKTLKLSQDASYLRREFFDADSRQDFRLRTQIQLRF